MKTKQLVIYGIGETAEIACEYFTHDSDYEVVAFTADRDYLLSNTCCNLPAVAFEEVDLLYPPGKFEIFVAASFNKLNRVRMAMYQKAKSKGYTCASYISSKAFVWNTAHIGDNAFILENNVIQHDVTIGNNVSLWSGNHVGHRTVVEDHVSISSHCVISGFCRIGKGSFLGVNCTFNDSITLGRDNLVGSGALIIKNTAPGSLMTGSPAKASPVTTYQFFKLEAETPVMEQPVA
ncbi:MAG TPA: acetyltransferase [Lacibacter sp.]|nr:acetyltransferase [Lacibacter sp.]HMO90219.1 acetyltransferase [Lacibacter sp.]